MRCFVALSRTHSVRVAICLPIFVGIISLRNGSWLIGLRMLSLIFRCLHGLNLSLRHHFHIRPIWPGPSRFACNRMIKIRFPIVRFGFDPQIDLLIPEWRRLAEHWRRAEARIEIRTIESWRTAISIAAEKIRIGATAAHRCIRMVRTAEIWSTESRRNIFASTEMCGMSLDHAEWGFVAEYLSHRNPPRPCWKRYASLPSGESKSTGTSSVNSPSLLSGLASTSFGNGFSELKLSILLLRMRCCACSHVTTAINQLIE